MTDKENITAILECYFSGFKKERIDSACNRILGLKHHINVDALVPKTQELSQAIFDAGYKQGYNEGTASHAGERGSLYYGGYGDGHKDGLNDAWECARKIVEDVVEPNFESGYMVDIFRCESAITAMKNNSPSEAIAKIKEYEEKQKQANDEIKVGDEVYLSSLSKSYPRIVLSLYGENDGLGLKARTMLSSGTIDIKPVSEFKKTGRHFDQIAEVLKQLKEGEK